MRKVVLGVEKAVRRVEKAYYRSRGRCYRNRDGLYGSVWYVDFLKTSSLRLLVASLDLSAWFGDAPFGDMSLTNSI